MMHSITKNSRAILAHSQILPGLLLLIMALILSGCSDNSGGKAKAENGPKKRAAPVSIGLSSKRTVPVELKAIGTVEPFATVAIKSQITGTLKNIHFKEGDDVRKGDLLFSLDPRPFTAMLNQAQGSLIRDKAQLDNARKELERYTNAAKKGYVSIEQAEQAETKVATLAATIKADEAAVENARLQLEFCTIYAPIDGRTGELPVAEGNLIKANADTAMVTINQVAPIKISFTVPGKHFGEIKKYRDEGPLRVTLAGPGGDPLTGTFSFLDNTLDPATGTIRLKAEFANKDKNLWPGQFVEVRLHLTSRPDVTVVPTQAVQIGQNGAHVFVVKDDATVEDRYITAGVIFDGDTVVESGLAPGERVVTDGQLQLTGGTKVEERGKPSADKATEPVKSSRETPRGTP
ncbi:MAG: efflux RND transporter periplasmic adaptor subunit [Proteobacteria bacterium]|nr:efflux RND transporter periplasmic adaptor subunit [Pseudomonadota bacterium]